MTVANWVTRAEDLVFLSASRNASAASRTWSTAFDCWIEPDASSTSVRSTPHFSVICGFVTGVTAATAGAAPKPATPTRSGPRRAIASVARTGTRSPTMWSYARHAGRAGITRFGRECQHIPCSRDASAGAIHRAQMLHP